MNETTNAVFKKIKIWLKQTAVPVYILLTKVRVFTTYNKIRKTVEEWNKKQTDLMFFQTLISKE